MMAILFSLDISRLALADEAMFGRRRRGKEENY